MKKTISAILIISLLICTLCSCSIIKTRLGSFLPSGSSEKVPAEELTLDRYTLSINAGEAVKLSAASSSQTLKWSSSDESVALVNSEGTVTGVRAGVANITCAAENGAEVTCTVTVSEKAQSESEPEQEPETSVADEDFIFADSSVRQLSEMEISQKLYEMEGEYTPSGKHAQDAINEIYARHGYKFNNQKILEYYQSKSWYSPRTDFSESELNEYEKYNIDLISKFK